MSNVPESMFAPGSTPYGPPVGAAPVAAPAQPYVAAPGAWTAAVEPPKRLKNGLGVASVWLGAVALLVSFSGLSLNWLFIILAAIFGFVGVARVGRPRVAATVGLALAGFSLLIGILVTVSRF